MGHSKTEGRADRDQGPSSAKRMRRGTDEAAFDLGFSDDEELQEPDSMEMGLIEDTRDSTLAPDSGLSVECSRFS